MFQQKDTETYKAVHLVFRKMLEDLAQKTEKKKKKNDVQSLKDGCAQGHYYACQFAGPPQFTLTSKSNNS